MENNAAVRAQNGPSALDSLTAQAAPSSPNGDAFTAVFAGHSRTNPFKGQWSDDSKAMFENLTRQFGDELKDTKPDNGSETPGSAPKSGLPTGDKVCPEIETEQKTVGGKLKDVDFVTIHGRCNSHNSNGSNNTGQADGNPITGAPPPTPNPSMALDPKLAEPEKSTQTLDYLQDSFEQLALGNYTDKVTALGTGAQIATGLLGLDLPADIRDLTHDLTHWQWSWGHVGQTLLDGVGVLPVFGSIKYLDEAGALVKGAAKHLDETADVAKSAENTFDKIGNIKGGILKSEDANVLEHIEKTERNGYNRTDSLEGPTPTKKYNKGEFKTKGLDVAARKRYLESPDGQLMQTMLKKADPGKPDYIYKSRADDLLKSSKDIPTKRTVQSNEPLYKLVKDGEKPSQYTPYWLTESELAELRKNPSKIADRLGLPNDSVSPGGKYSVWETKPAIGKKPTIFESTVAPTVEGATIRAGGGAQALVLNRQEWQQPVLKSVFP